MAEFDALIEISGNATVATELELTADEEKAAQHMSELVATLQLVSVNTYELEYNEVMFKQVADLFNITVDRVSEIFRSLKVKHLRGESGIGPLKLNY